MTPSTVFELSATRLKKYLACPRAYYLHYVARVPEDTVGGAYLQVGTAYDLHVQHYASAGARGVESIDPKIRRMFAAARPALPAPGTVDVQTEYRIDAGGFIVTGKPDLRSRGVVVDTKTTSADGPGEGSAMTATQLAADVQAQLYAWCELFLDPALDRVACTWHYVNKDTRPRAWSICAVLDRRPIETWFAGVVRPAAAAMQALHAATEQTQAESNPPACGRCWVRGSCVPFAGLVRKGTKMAGFKLSQLRAAPAPKEDTQLVDQLAASVAALRETNDALDRKVNADREARNQLAAINPPDRFEQFSTADLAAELLRRVL